MRAHCKIPGDIIVRIRKHLETMTAVPVVPLGAFPERNSPAEPALNVPSLTSRPQYVVNMRVCWDCSQLSTKSTQRDHWWKCSLRNGLVCSDVEADGVCFGWELHSVLVRGVQRDVRGGGDVSTGNTVPPFLVTRSLELRRTFQIAFHTALFGQLFTFTVCRWSYKDGIWIMHFN